MDTRTIASRLGTEPKILRRYLRDPRCPFKPVGSGSRYTFSNAELEELTTGFIEWSRGKSVVSTTPRRKAAPTESQESKDAEVWKEEEESRQRRGKGAIVLDDIWDPRVRARVKAEAARQEQRLNDLLLARGLHIMQRGQRS